MYIALTEDQLYKHNNQFENHPDDVGVNKNKEMRNKQCVIRSGKIQNKMNNKRRVKKL